MSERSFLNVTEKMVFSELLISASRVKGNGFNIDLDCFLNKIVDMFKHDDGFKETLQATLMAANIPNEENGQEP
jgi:hypothetical protein